MSDMLENGMDAGSENAENGKNGLFPDGQDKANTEDNAKGNAVKQAYRFTVVKKNDPLRSATNSLNIFIRESVNLPESVRKAVTDQLVQARDTCWQQFLKDEQEKMQGLS